MAIKFKNLSSGGSSADALGELLSDTLTNYQSETLTTIKKATLSANKVLESIDLPNLKDTTISGAFKNCTKLKQVNLPNLETEYGATFEGCTSLEEVVLPKLQYANERTFYNCTNLKKAYFSSMTIIGQQTFYGCSQLKAVLLDKVTNIGGMAFRSCSSMQALIIRTNSTSIVLSSSAFESNGTFSGYIYFKDELVDTYKSATNWSVFAGNIKPLSELPNEIKEEFGL